jgi:8-oxo-dGTP diphosphatase
VDVSHGGDGTTGTRTKTVPIYVVRHAKAGSRQRWTGPDDQRPLSRGGFEQAQGLVRLFAGRPLARLVSSPYIRCVQTLEPLSEERGLPVETSQLLAEGASLEGALALAVESAQLGPSALCTHGDVIELLLDDLSRDGVRLETQSGIDLKKGSTWILQLLDGDVVSAEYVPPYADNGR